jgi:hypothetical protein
LNDHPHTSPIFLVRLERITLHAFRSDLAFSVFFRYNDEDASPGLDLRLDGFLHPLLNFPVTLSGQCMSPARVVGFGARGL